jgi:hypothetical protein
VRERRHAARQHAAALAHAGDADEVGPEVPAALRLLALAVEDRGHVPVEGEDVRVRLVRVRQVPGVELRVQLRPLVAGPARRSTSSRPGASARGWVRILDMLANGQCRCRLAGVPPLSGCALNPGGVRHVRMPHERVREGLEHVLVARQRHDDHARAGVRRRQVLCLALELLCVSACQRRMRASLPPQ